MSFVIEMFIAANWYGFDCCCNDLNKPTTTTVVAVEVQKSPLTDFVTGDKFK